MADNNFRSYLKGEIVRRKKYLYVLRPLLAVKWIENEMGVVPIEFDKLLASTVSDSDLHKEIEELLILKRAGMESDEGPRFQSIHSFIESEFERHGDDHNQSPGSRADINELNKIFRNTIENDAPTKHGT